MSRHCCAGEYWSLHPSGDVTARYEPLVLGSRGNPTAETDRRQPSELRGATGVAGKPDAGVSAALPSTWTPSPWAADSSHPEGSQLCCVLPNRTGLADA